MNICEIIKLARSENKAFRQDRWAADDYVYHGMDNIIRYGGSDEPMDFSVATLLYNGWELCDNQPYHGKLATLKIAALV